MSLLSETEKASETRGNCTGRVSLILQRSSASSFYDKDTELVDFGNKLIVENIFLASFIAGRLSTAELLLRPMFYSFPISICMSVASDW